jgi:hypothetical protein
MGIIVLIVFIYMKLDVNSLLGHITGLVAGLFATSIVIYYAGLDMSERELIKHLLINRIKGR